MIRCSKTKNDTGQGRNLFRSIPLGLLLALISTLVYFPGCQRGNAPFGKAVRLAKEAVYHGTEPITGQDGAMECLAENIDWLEHHIDRHGSIVAKQADIWGEARLTKHRDEYERELYKELNQFNATINASIRQTDSSFATQAIALAAAASDSTIPTDVTAQKQAAKVLTASTQNIKASTKDNASSAAIGLDPVTLLDQRSRYIKHLHELRRINEGDDTSDSPGYSMNLVRIPVSLLPGKLTRKGFGAEITITAEPVITNDLLPTTFQNLVINDVVDQLGLALVRTVERGDDFKELDEIVESQKVLTTTMDAYITAIENGDFDKTICQEHITKLFANKLAHEHLALVVAEVRTASSQNDAKRNPEKKIINDRAHKTLVKNYSDFRMMVRQDSLFATKQQTDSETPVAKGLMNTSDDALKLLDNIFQALVSKNEKDFCKDLQVLNMKFPSIPSTINNIVQKAQEKLISRETALLQQEIALAPTGRVRRATNPLNPTFMPKVIGVQNLVVIARSFAPAYEGRYVRWAGYKECLDAKGNPQECRVNLLDMRRWLQPEVDAAYRLLSQPEHIELWYDLASPQSKLAAAIRSGHFGNEKTEHTDLLSVKKLQKEFFKRLHSDHSHDCAKNSVDALAWAIVVESALLNERLNEDIRKLAVAKQAPHIALAKQLSFFLPESANSSETVPPHIRDEFNEATLAFQEYVKVRWPIHVFAVDPVAQDQNVADASVRRREMQFAMALGFVTGQVNGRSMTQYSRTLQTDVETVSLNRTIVGFGHGSDTFGWRFYPRVQALDVPGTAATLWQSINGTPRDADVKRREIEPGQRECVAVVLMPSFVPYVDLHIRSNWISLTNPKNATLTMKETLRLSRAITTMRKSRSECVQCEHLYRPMELQRLLKRVDQLDRELPLQTLRAQVPYENTLGGFEMFNTGVTDLGPELIGWYGAPGVVVGDSDYKCGCEGSCSSTPADTTAAKKSKPLPVCEGKGTTLFLVGDNFSVHNTKVIAGGICIPHIQLISREIMRVTIPACVNTVDVDGKDYVSVYVATPYGVTSHLHVPTHTRKIVSKKADVIKQIAIAQVKESLKALQLPSRAITIAPTDSKQSVLKISASCISASSCASASDNLVFKIRPGGKVNVTYSVKNDPTLAGKIVSFSAVMLYDNKFLGGLISVHGPVIIGENEKFNVTGEYPEILMNQLSKNIDRLAFKDKAKPIKAKLVVYASVAGSPIPTRVLQEIDVEITLIQCDCKEENPPVTSAANGGQTRNLRRLPSTKMQASRSPKSLF